MKKIAGWLKIGMLCVILGLTGCGSEQETEQVPVVRIGIGEKAGISQDFDEVNEKLGELTEEKTGIRAQLVWTGTGGNYYKNRQMKVDITNMYFKDFENAKEKNLLLDMTDYLSQAPALQEIRNQKVELASWNQQGVYAIPKPLSDLHGDGVVLNRQYVEKYQMDISQIHKPEDLEPFFDIIKENEPKVTPWVLEKRGNAVIERGVEEDMLDDCLSCLLYDGEDVVTNYYESDVYKRQVERARRWREEGYLAQNVMTEIENGKNQVIAGEAFATECVIKPDENQYDESIYGDQVIIKAFDNSVKLDTESDWVLVWSIYRETEYPKEAVKILNLLYEDPDVLNLILYGIEGEHYEVAQDGSFVYPEGVTPENVRYMNNSRWKYDTTKAGVWEGMSKDLKGEMKALREGAQISKAYGFWLDEDRISVNLDKLREIVKKYTKLLKTGSCDTENTLARFRQELKVAGSAQLIKEVQLQYDEWKSVQKEQNSAEKEQ